MRTIDHDELNRLAGEPDAAVALVRQQPLETAGLDRVLFPPTFAGDGYKGTGYAIDELGDGTLTALVDTVGSQSNRMEALFVGDGAAGLGRYVPQVFVSIEKQGSDGETVRRDVSVMEAGHRLGDALIRASGLAEEARAAFFALLERGDHGPIARISPTTLVFGAWDSRDSQAKLPRIVQSTVRAWDVDVLKRSAQYAPPIDYAQYGVFDEEAVEEAEQAAVKASKNPLAVRGYVPVPATDSHGGVRVNGRVTRDVVVNLIALRRVKSPDHEHLSRYVLGLSLAAAASPVDGAFRQGCLLVPAANDPAPWQLVGRDGTREDVAIDLEAIRAYLEPLSKPFVGATRIVSFDRARARADVTEAPEKAAKKKARAKK